MIFKDGRIARMKKLTMQETKMFNGGWTIICSCGKSFQDDYSKITVMMLASAHFRAHPSHWIKRANF